MDIPKEPKTYTTVYGNLKGVDFTNDPTNVYRLRSPNGLNMTPNMDGSPRKRHGWEIAFTPVDYCVALCAAVNDSPGEVMYINEPSTSTSVDFLVTKDGTAASPDTGDTFYVAGIMSSSGEIFEYVMFMYWDGSQYKNLPDSSSLVEKSKDIAKVSYLELGGEDWLIIFSSLGVFSYGENEGLKAHYFPYTYNGTSYTKVNTPLVELDPNKSFFFEGHGEAGLYMFAKLQPLDTQFKLYRFTVDAGVSYVVVKDAYIPTTHIASTPTLSSSTIYENVNLLTAKRMVKYMGNGTALYSIPSPGSSIDKVEVLESGTWVTKTSGTDYTVQGSNPNITGVQFQNTLPATSTEDNVCITYTPSNSNFAVTTNTITRAWQTVTVKRTGTQTRYIAVAPTNYHTLAPLNITGVTSRTYYTDWETTWSGYSTGQATFDVTSLHEKDYTTQYLNGSSASTLSTSYRSVDLTSYANKAVVKVGSAIYGSSCSTTSDKTVYGAVSSGTPASWTYNNIGKHFTNVGFTKAQSDKLLEATYNAYQKRRSMGLPGTVYATLVKQTRTITRTKTYKIRITYTAITQAGDKSILSVSQRPAFAAASRAIVYGNGLINQVFIGSSTEKDYTNRVWYSAATDVSYFPDLNYMEVGANDTRIMGMMKVGEYLGIIKQASSLDSSVYLAYPTSFEDNTAYAIKQKVAGVGAVSNGAFNVLNDEPLFLSKEGVMAIVPSEDSEKQLKNRSYYINKRLLAEEGLENAVSFIYKNMYLLAINGHVYILDGAQKSSWANERTNLQYECYYWDNVPAKNFAKLDDQLWFSDFNGNLCRFKQDETQDAWFDEYSLGYIAYDVNSYASDLSDYQVDKNVFLENFPQVGGYSVTPNWGELYTDKYIYEDASNEYGATWLWESSDAPQTPARIITASLITPEEGTLYRILGTYNPETEEGVFESAHIQEIVMWDGEKYVNATPESWSILYTSTSPYTPLINEVPVEMLPEYGVTINDTLFTNSSRVFLNVIGLSTITEEIEDEEGNIETFTGAPIHTIWSTIMDDDGMPQYFKNLEKKGSMVILTPSSNSGVTVSLRADNKKPVTVGTITAQSMELPIDYYTKKKIKKYKRLQFICENEGLLDSFGIDQIIKVYSIGNYSKNR